MQSLLSHVEEPPVRFTRFFGSVVAHIVLVATAVALSRFVAADNDEIDWSRFRVEPLRLHESVPVIFVPSPASATGAGSEAVALRRHGKPGPTVLEPEYRPEARLPKTVPPLAHWSRVAPAPAPKPVSSQILTPGTVEAPTAAPQLTDRSSLSVPNRETATGNVNISLPPSASPTTPRLTAANASTLPLQAADPAPGRAASFDMTSGQAVNVLALSKDRSAATFVEIERGLQNVAGSQGLGARENVSRETDRERAGIAEHAGRAGEPAAAARTDNSVDISKGGSEPARVAASSKALRALAESEIKRISHPPNGSYDVVVAQAAGTLDPSFGLARGPVYTVYLPVGDDREWVLDFCAIGESQKARNDYYLMVGDDDSITPPFPLTTAIPPKLLAAISTKLVLHGSISAAGRFSSIRLEGSTSRAGEVLMALLDEWRFRPAMRNRTPVDVDVRLVVPARN